MKHIFGLSIRYYWKKSGYWNGVMTKTVKGTWPSISHVDAAYEYKGRDIALLFEGTVLAYARLSPAQVAQPSNPTSTQ